MRYILILMVSLFFFPEGYTQNEKRVYRKYGTQKVFKKQKKEHKDYLQAIKQQARHQHKTAYKPRPVTIPMVFHIVHANNENRITEAQVMSQIEALNRDFSNQSFREQELGKEMQQFAKLAADTEVRFCLAAADENGKKTGGVNYHRISNSPWSNDDAIKQKKTGVEPWKTDDYLNVWVAALEDNLSGYAQMPGGPKNTDGIVIDYRFFGTTGTAVAPYNQGKTLTHLIGNYLNLQDLWSEENYCRDDGVQDTPIHNSANFGCPPYRQISLCTGNPVEMTMNFMDNTDDNCAYMFTRGQKKRMQLALSKGGVRESLTKGKTQCGDDSLAEEGAIARNTIADDKEQKTELSIYPNPTIRELNIESNKAIQSIRVFDLMGRIIYQSEYSEESGLSKAVIATDNWDSGIYLIKVFSGKDTLNQKVVVSK